MIGRVVVTGGAGFIGSAMVRFLIGETDCQVLNLDKLTYAANLASLAGISSEPRYTFVQGDINDRLLLRRIFASFKPDLMLHLAAESHVDRSIDDPGVFVTTNVHGTFSLLHEALSYWRGLPRADHGQFQFCHVSTDEVFGSLGPTGAFSEASRYSPTSPYAASKASSDHLTHAWHNTYGLPVMVSICCNNYGPFQFPEKLIPLIILKGLYGEHIPVYGQGENVRDWIYVNDHARTLWAIANAGQPGETYLVGSRSETRNIDVVTAVTRILDELSPSRDGPRERLIRFVADRPGHDFRYAICADKIAQRLHWRPQESFESGLRKTVEWYLQNRSWWESIRAERYKGDRLGLPNGQMQPRLANFDGQTPA